MIFVDTNYFLRYLLNDIPEQHNEAKQLFLSASEGKEDLITSVLVFFEIYWVLRSFYELRKEEIIESLSKVLKLSFIKLEEREILMEALDLFEKNTLSLEDCYNLFYAKTVGVKEFKTFDKKLDKEFKK